MASDCYPPRVAKPTITLVGAGNLAQALAPALRRAGYAIHEIVVRNNPASRRRGTALARRVGARVASSADARLVSDILWICVTDDAITPAARALADRWKGTVALHSSGALASDALTPLARKGISLASLHPMMTFVGRSAPSFVGVAFAVEGDAAATRAATRIARDLGGSVFRIAKEGKTLYHAMGSFSSPMVIATLAMAERIGRAAGVPRAYLPKVLRPILRQTLENYFRRGAAGAFSGPIVRADLETVRRHLAALKEVRGARQIYVALARSALQTLPVRDRAALRRILR